MLEMFLLLVGFLVYSGLFTVSQQKLAIIERFGKFVKIAHPGLNIMIPFKEILNAKIYLKFIS